MCVVYSAAVLTPSRQGNLCSQPGKSGERLRLPSTRMELVIVMVMVVMQELVNSGQPAAKKIMIVSD